MNAAANHLGRRRLSPQRKQGRRLLALRAPLRPLVLLLLLIGLITGCRQDMAEQPKFKPLEQSSLFPNNQASRPLEAGTVARGRLREDSALFAGTDQADPRPAWVAALVGAGNPWNVLALTARETELAERFPFPVTEEVMKRGRERFNIYCAVCHGRLGDGNGKIVQRAYLRPPSYHTDRLRRAPVGHFYEVVTHGYGGMPDYAQQIPPRDRWAIIAYIRALQESQNSRLEDLPEEERRRLQAEAQP